jgi:beta-mannanase
MNYLKTVLLLFVFAAGLPQISAGQKKHQLSNPKATKEAKALYSYLQDMYGKKILSGQMWSSWGIDELKYINEVTGKQPAIRGMDFISERDNENEVKFAIDWWKTGGIPTIMWHMGAPGIGEGYENSKKEIDIDKVFEKGTRENTVFWKELKSKGDLLQKINEAHVPVLWRPFHELNGNWFWWGKQGPEKFKKLWITMYDYYTKERKLNNLIWVLCYTGKPDSAWYPGDQYVDIAGADMYSKTNEPQAAMYTKVKEITGTRIPITYHECGIPPDPEKCLKENIMWSWWMEWHTSHLQSVDKDYLKYVYNHDLIITKDEVPDILKMYK